MTTKTKKKRARKTTTKKAAAKRAPRKNTPKKPAKKRRSGASSPTLQVGDFAKLVFVPDVPRADLPASERLWVRVKRSLGFGRYEGTLDSEPLFLTGVRRGMTVPFEKRQVIEIIRA